MNLAGTVSLATALQPDTKNVFVVSGVGANALLEAARQQLRPFEPRLAITYLAGLPVADLEARLARLPAHSIVYYLVLDRDGAGEKFHPLEYLSRVTEIANAPVYSWVDSAMDHGIVGGSLKDQVAQAQAVGEVALRVLRGEPADSIPPVTRDLNVVQVDSRQLRRWAISESRVPTGTTIRFREPTLWDRYASYIIVAAVVVLAQSALIGGLLLQHNRRRRAEAQLRKHQVELRQSYDRIRDLGARLLNAQESERSRVARDLHDDISQQMALLEIDLEQLAGVVEGEAQDLTARNAAPRAGDRPQRARLVSPVAPGKAPADRTRRRPARVCGGSYRNRISRSRLRTRMFRRRCPRTWRSASSGSSRKRCTTRSSTVTVTTCRLSCTADHRGSR